MKTSLIDLARVGKDIGVTPAEVHYPADGSSRLHDFEQSHFWFSERRRIIFKLLQKHLKDPSTKPTGLDIGCGSGYTAVWLSEKGIPTLGLDAIPGFEIYRSKNKGFGFVLGDIFSVTPKAEFDFVLLLDVIEHLKDDQSFVEQAVKFLKPGGVLLATVPAFSWQWTDLDEASGHFRRYVKSDFRKFENLSTSQLELKYQTYFYASTLPLYLVNRLLRKKTTIKKNQESELMINPLLNKILQSMVRMESFLIPHFSLPLGSSLISILRKN